MTNPTKIILLFALLANTALALNLTSNQTLEYNWTSSPGNETFYCSEPEQQSFCGFENLTFSINPGSTVIRTGSFSRVEAVCTSNVTNMTAKCVISDNLKPGETLRVDTNTCDLDIRVKQVDTADACDVEQVKHDEIITFDFQQDNLIHITAGNQTIDVDPRTDTLEQIKHRVTYTCPYVIDKNDLLRDDQVINTCKTLLPELAQSFVRTSNKCIDTMTDTTRLISDRSNDIRVCEEEKGRYLAQVAELEQKVAQGTNVTNDLRTQLAIASQSADSEKNQKYVYMFLTGVLLVCSVFLLYLNFGGAVRE